MVDKDIYSFVSSFIIVMAKLNFKN